jgi:hypothetical protein
MSAGIAGTSRDSLPLTSVGVRAVGFLRAVHIRSEWRDAPRGFQSPFQGSIRIGFSWRCRSRRLGIVRPKPPVRDMPKIPKTTEKMFKNYPPKS